MMMMITTMDDSIYKTTTFTTVLIFLGFHARFYTNTEEKYTIVTEISIHPMLLYGLFVPVFALGVITLLSRWRIVTNYIQQKISNSTKNGCLKSCGSYAAFSSLKKVSSVDRLKNLSRNLLSSLDSCSLLLQAITRKECFARLDYIERLSINDIAILFRYASDVNLIDFDKSKFLSEQTKIVRGVVTAMDMAVKVSRGCLTEGTKTTEAERGEGDVDALYFVAATRIFAEWRNMRLVPKGYQRYAVGLSLAYRDVLQNLEKIERGIHDYLRYHQALDTSNSVKPIPSPTLRQLLKYELDTKMHKKLPCLGEKSAASGLLWTKRQLHYQVATLNNTLEVPHCYPTAKEAASAAYRIVYDEYHGWAVKKIFSHSFGGSPPLDEIWLCLDPPKGMPENKQDL